MIGVVLGLSVWALIWGIGWWHFAKQRAADLGSISPRWLDEQTRNRR